MFERAEDRKRREATAGAHATEQTRIIRHFHLSRDEVARARTMQPGDPISDYSGSFAVQAAMMAQERADAAAEIPPNIILGSE